MCSMSNYYAHHDDYDELLKLLTCVDQRQFYPPRAYADPNHQSHRIIQSVPRGISHCLICSWNYSIGCCYVAVLLGRHCYYVAVVFVVLVCYLNHLVIMPILIVRCLLRGIRPRRIFVTLVCYWGVVFAAAAAWWWWCRCY